MIDMQSKNDQARAARHPGMGLLAAARRALRRLVRPDEPPPPGPNGPTLRGHLKATIKAVAPFPVDD
jgi:hypothetical protein